jgi:DNA polymerase I-like protein with 3'-5' exonuclease and polymerase domains
MKRSGLPDLRGIRIIACDVETEDMGLARGIGPGWAMGISRLVGASFAWDEVEKKQVYLSVGHPDSDNLDIRSWLSDLFRQEETLFVFFNASYDLGNIQSNYDIPPPRNLVDTAAMAAIVDENRFSYSLDDIARDYGLPGKDETLLNAALKERGLKGKGLLHRLPAHLVAPYAEQDARTTLDLYHILKEELERENTTAAAQLESELIPLILEMRKRGIRIDANRAEQAVTHFAAKRDEVLSELGHKLAAPVDMAAIRSPRWLSSTFQKEQVAFPYTEKGNPSFEAKWMKKSEHWLPRLIVQAKQFEDASSKFFGNYVLKFANRGRIHPTINQFHSEDGGTRSHRFSYSAPPLQQAPARDGELAPAFRGVFLPEPGERWMAADYSQQEYRLMVHYAELRNKPGARAAGELYRNDPTTDFHDMVAQMTGLPRKRAKDTNFAKAYGAGIAQFSEMTGMTPDEAKATMLQYDTRLPFIKSLSDECTRRAEDTGQIRLLDGALCHFPLWESAVWGTPGMPTTRERAVAKTRNPADPWYNQRLKRAWAYKALNRLIQGSAARQVKIAMRNCWHEGLVPLIQVHDELGFSLQQQNQALRIQEIMMHAVELTVPMKVDMEFGHSWGDSMKGHKWEEVEL